MAGRISRHEVSVGNLISGGSGPGTTMLTMIVSLDPIHLEFDMSEQLYLGYQRAIRAGLIDSHRDGVAVQARLFD